MNNFWYVTTTYCYDQLDWGRNLKFSDATVFHLYIEHIQYHRFKENYSNHNLNNNFMVE